MKPPVLFYARLSSHIYSVVSEKLKNESQFASQQLLLHATQGIIEVKPRVAICSVHGTLPVCLPKISAS